jgi:hypothetical protein
MRQIPRAGVLSSLRDSDVVILDGNGCSVSDGVSDEVKVKVSESTSTLSVETEGVGVSSGTLFTVS